MRRKFADALPKNIESSEVTITAQAIGFINKLFKIEQTLEGESVEKRQKERFKQAKPELEAFGAWAEKIAPTVLPKSKLGEAFGYVFNHKEGLMTYLEDGNC